MSFGISLLGPPGSGKGTLGSSIELEFNFNRICTGDLLRSIATDNSDLGRKINSKISRGELVDSADIFNILVYKISSLSNNNWILDGFPRNKEQLMTILNSECSPKLFIYLSLSKKKLIERLLGRRIHLNSGRTYHILFNPPKVKWVDDITGEPLVQRDDDNIDIIKHRLELDELNHKALLSELKSISDNKAKLFILDSDQPIDTLKEMAFDIIKKYAL